MRVRSVVQVSAQTDSNETPLGVAAFEDRLPMMWMLHAKVCVISP